MKPPHARATRWLTTVAAAGIALAGLSAANADPAATVHHKAPAGTVGGLSVVAAVPHSSDIWALGAHYVQAEAHNIILRRHHGHWKRFTSPKLGNPSQSSLSAIVAAGHRIYLGGARAAAAGQSLPVIYRLRGKKFVKVKLPALFAGGTNITQMAASSPSDIWAVGEMSPPANTDLIALHWNGKHWSEVAYPEGTDSQLVEVSTSGPHNAWAIRADGALLHWDGSQWTQNGAAPANSTMTAIATSSSKLAYAVGYRESASTAIHPVVMRFNGKNWSRAKLKSAAPGTRLLSVTIDGRSAWATGSHTTKNDVAVPVILHTSGGTWRPQGSFNSAGYNLSSIAAASTKRAYAVGTYERPDSDTAVTFVDVNTGHGWKPIPSKS
jgi:hypothetical protein